jgi:hypothetical protein
MRRTSNATTRYAHVVVRSKRRGTIYCPEADAGESERMASTICRIRSAVPACIASRRAGADSLEIWEGFTGVFIENPRDETIVADDSGKQSGVGSGNKMCRKSAVTEAATPSGGDVV